MNILGVVVKTLPKNADSVKTALENSNLCDVHAVEDGKIIVTIEGIDDSEALGKLRQIESIKGVLASDLIHIASEEDPNQVGEVNLDAINAHEDAEKILYGGSVYNALAKAGR